MNSAVPFHDNRPWYRQFWPWFLFILPATVVVAGFATLGIAIKHADVRVDGDYSKQGLALSGEATSEEVAAGIGLNANVAYTSDHLIVNLRSTDFERLTASQRALMATPTLSLHISHPTDAKQDQHLTVQIMAFSRYIIELDAEARAQVQGRRYLTLEYSESSETDNLVVWRLQGECELQPLETSNTDEIPCQLGSD